MILSSSSVIFISLASDIVDQFQSVVNLLRKNYRKNEKTLRSISIFEDLSKKKSAKYRALRFSLLCIVWGKKFGIDFSMETWNKVTVFCSFRFPVSSLCRKLWLCSYFTNYILWEHHLGSHSFLLIMESSVTYISREIVCPLPFLVY